MKTTTLALAGLIALTTNGLGAQESARERARSALPADVYQRIEAIAQAGAAQGIPDEPLFNKALEGFAKRVPTDRLLPVVEGYAARLGVARSAFGMSSTVPLLVAGADALQRGVTVEALTSLAQVEGQGRSPVAVLVLADLVETGVPTERALSVLREAMQQRTREEGMLDIPEQVRRLVREGASPFDAAEQVRQRLQRGRGGGEAGPPVPPGSEPATRERIANTRRGGD